MKQKASRTKAKPKTLRGFLSALARTRKKVRWYHDDYEGIRFEGSDKDFRYAAVTMCPLTAVYGKWWGTPLGVNRENLVLSAADEDGKRTTREQKLHRDLLKACGLSRATSRDTL